MENETKDHAILNRSAPSETMCYLRNGNAERCLPVCYDEPRPRSSPVFTALDDCFGRESQHRSFLPHAVAYRRGSAARDAARALGEEWSRSGTDTHGACVA